LIPSRNRPALLAEALASVADQTHADHEVIVVDDASAPAVDASVFDAAGVHRFKLLRNDQPTGQARARELAEAAASGQFVVHLDDDDLLAPDALARGVAAFQCDAGLDVLFFNVRGFGERAVFFNRNQGEALARVLRSAGGAGESDLVIFGPAIFEALLRSVPLAFQRPMARRQVWRAVSALRRRAYPDGHPLRPPLRESEWGLYAAATQKVGLLTSPLYLQRCSGQGYFSVDTQREAAERAIIEVMEGLGTLAQKDQALSSWRNDIRRAVARTHFDRAYGDFHRGSRRSAHRHLMRALAFDTRFAYLRFAVRMLLPIGRPAHQGG
jgi:glycosyltransferase involved in cell wall biosynthesis